MDLHDDRRAPDGVLLFELLAEGLVGHVLQIDVERRHHVVSVDGILVVTARHAAVEAARDTLPQGLSVPPGQLLAIGLLDAVVAAVARQTDRTPGQIALGVDAFVAFDEVVDHAHVPVQERIAPQHLPLGIVHLAGEDVHGGMVAQRVVDAARDVLLAAQAVKETGDAPLGAQVGRIARAHQPVAAGVLLAELPGVGRGGLVLEEGGQQFGQRVGLFAEGVERVEARRGEVEGGLIAEDRGGQRIAVAREDASALGGDHLLGEDSAGQAVGVVGDLRAEELHPDQPQEHDASGQEEEHVEQPHAQQDVTFDFRTFLLHGGFSFR